MALANVADWFNDASILVGSHGHGGQKRCEHEVVMWTYNGNIKFVT